MLFSNNGFDVLADAEIDTIVREDQRESKQLLLWSLFASSFNLNKIFEIGSVIAALLLL